MGWIGYLYRIFNEPNLKNFLVAICTILDIVKGSHGFDNTTRMFTMLTLADAKKMLNELLSQTPFDEKSLAKALGVYPKTLREILNQERDDVPKGLMHSLIKLYCSKELSASNEMTEALD